MAKKAKKRLEADEEVRSFTFPEFDVPKFLKHEFEQSSATAIALVLALALAFISFGVDRLSLISTLASAIPLAIGVGTIAASPFLIMRLRPSTEDYTKGDWAGLIVTQFFGWLGLWFLLLNVFPT